MAVIHAVVKVAKGHILRDVGGGGVVVVGGVGGVRGSGGSGGFRWGLRWYFLGLLVARRHKVDYPLRLFHVSYYCCFRLKLRRCLLPNV